MAADQVIYFGNLRKAGWVKAPDRGLDASPVGSIDSMGFGNGGAFAQVSGGTHREYGWQWTTVQMDDIQFIYNYRNGLYGTGLMYWVDLYSYQYNALPPHWAAPFLSCRDWPSLMGSGITGVETAAPSALNNQPIASATYVVSTPANTVPDRGVVLLIPPTMKLSIGFSGSATNGGVVRVQPYNVNGTLAATVDMTLLSEAGTTRKNRTFSGATYSAIKIYLSSTVSGTSTVTLSSGDATYSLIAGADPTVGNHYEGRGHSGLQFASDPTLSYEYYDPTGVVNKQYVSAACKFAEIGAWL